MLKNNISLNEVPENIMDWAVEYTPTFYDNNMVDEERRFVSGLIKYYDPQNILELGVACGGGSVNILSTILDSSATLTSIDLLEEYEKPLGGRAKVGSFVWEQFECLPENKWNLLLGKDPSERMEELNQKFDFVVLDTAHLHPVETLNFLTILPYLKDNAIVVMHDITCYMGELKHRNLLHCFATRMLCSSICAEKLIPDITGYGGYTNIMAFRVTEDTRKYIRNLFDSLMLPWEMIPDTIASVGKIIEKYYPAELQKVFREAYKFNLELEVLRYKKMPESIINKMEKEKPYFYGAGNNMKNILMLLKEEKEKFSCPIYDIKASEILSLDGWKVEDAKIIAPVSKEKSMIVTIENKNIFNELKVRFECMGYVVYHGIWNWFFDAR